MKNDKQTWQSLPKWRKRFDGFLFYQIAAWSAIFWPVQVDLAMYETLSDQFTDSNEKRYNK